MNISEGRDQEFLKKISLVIGACEDVNLLSCSSDIDHNRSVFTFVGSPRGILEASWLACKEAVAALDIRTHRGVHPRIGVVDVIPLVPLKNISMEECSSASHSLGNKIGSELKMPVFMYGEAAQYPERINLANIRKGGLPGLVERMKILGADYGPSRTHPTGGAVAVGSRDILVAFNIDLGSHDLAAAKRIASSIRESNGGLPCVKALGLFLESRNCVQVSMNLTDYRKTPVSVVFEAVRELAEKEGIEVRQSEIIGHLPRAALNEHNAVSMKIAGFEPEKVYIEDCLERLAGGNF